MCPGTLAIVATAASAGGSLIKGLSSAETAYYQGQVARQNARVAGQYANYSAQAGAAQTEVAGLKARSELAGVRAGAAARGVDVNSGSAADVQTSQRILGKFDQQTTQSNANQRVYGYETQEAGFQSQARLEDAQILPDIAGSALSAAGAVAGGIPDLPLGGAGASEAGGGGIDASGGTPSLLSSNPTETDNLAWMQQGASYGAPLDAPPYIGTTPPPWVTGQ